MKKHSRKLIPTILMLAVAAAMLATASYAWFSMNSEVTAGGLSVSAGAPTNLLISTNGTDYGYEATFAAHTGTGKLQPMSTATPHDTNTFFALSNSASVGPEGGTATDDSTFVSTATPLTVGSNEDGYYMDYTVYLKMSDGSPSAQVYLSGLTIQDSTSTSLCNAVRVALIQTDVVLGESVTDTIAIYGVDENDYTSPVYPIVSTSGTISDSTLQTETGAGTYSYREGYGVSVTSSEAVELTVRVWVEGQDSDCKNANAGATFDISLTFSTAQ